MATHNGAKWIEIQISSILSQLGPDDELIVEDDTSVDERNLGVDLTFERALSLAKGDILFLSDQDDVWYPEKVARFMSAFKENPDVTLVLSDADIIDSDGEAADKTYFNRRGDFIPGVIPNIMKCKFLGCAMAMKASMREFFLPFPKNIPGHDMWIGVINEYYGKSLFIPNSLIGYRRHGDNLSPEQRQGIAQMLVWRWRLIQPLAMRIGRGK